MGAEVGSAVALSATSREKRLVGVEILLVPESIDSFSDVVNGSSEATGSPRACGHDYADASSRDLPSDNLLRATNSARVNRRDFHRFLRSGGRIVSIDDSMLA